MKTIKFENGGFPLLADFFTTMQDGLTDAIKGLGTVYGNYAILNGCSMVVADPSSSVGAGYVLFDGVMHYVPAHTFAYTAGQSVVAYKVTTPIACPKNYDDGNSYDMADDVQVRFKGVASVGIGEVLSSVFVDYNTSWTLMTANLINNWGAANATQYGLPYYRKQGTMVYLKGGIAPSGTPVVPIVNEPFFVLPVGFRPATTRVFMALASSAITDGYPVAPELCFVRITSNGECFSTLNMPGNVSLSGIVFDTI